MSNVQESRSIPGNRKEFGHNQINLSPGLQPVSLNGIWGGNGSKISADYWKERLTFVGWVACVFALIISVVILYQNLIEILWGKHSASFISIWILCATFVGWIASVIYNKQDSGMRSLMLHGFGMVGVGIFCTVCTNVAYYHHTPAETLYDIGFAIVPEIPPGSLWRELSELMQFGLIFAILGSSIFRSYEKRVVFWEMWFRIMITSLGFRSLTVFWTILPGPAPHCRIGSPEYSPPEGWFDVFVRMGPLYGKTKNCGDLLYSGHTCVVTNMTWLVITKMAPKNPQHRRIFQMCGALYLFIFCCLVVGSRKHYTVDVVLGFIIGSLLFHRFKNGWKGPEGPVRKTTNTSSTRGRLGSAQEQELLI
eukprot:TRINITY_DN17393_c0_g1_i1.p1 TRINITY_DN17393_c0_g1~~TRINITY_DN17393_c0_g1_i1.p1  ORF type:complete len:365 (+),score=48.81 TRINITY_DN17393_c0_g1_i1:49-1143(+)